MSDPEGATYHLAHQRVRLDQKDYTLSLAKDMTRDLRRQEVATWKKVIRVFNHELGNSLGPISSLARSARALVAKGDTTKVDSILGVIGERASHLSTFLRSYGEVARLPRPRREPVPWEGFLEHLGHAMGFHPIVLAPPQTSHGFFDPAQLQQVFINLCKNAREAGSAPEHISLRFDASTRGTHIDVLDRGAGIPKDALASVLLPFYSTKRSGTGLGLALCREILQAHDGGIELANRPDGGTMITCIIGPAA